MPFSGRGLFCLGSLPSQEKNCFAQRRRDAEEEGGDEFFLSKNSASLILCARWMADEVVSDLSLDILILTDRPHSNSSFAALLVEKNQYLVNNFNFWIELNKVLD
jgi:hypothetical protein